MAWLKGVDGYGSVLAHAFNDAIHICPSMGVSVNGGIPKWLVCRENPIHMDDLGVPLLGNQHICPWFFVYVMSFLFD